MDKEFKKVTLFPKRASILGLSMFIFLFTLTSLIIYTMWNSLKEIDEYHFPMTERSAINVRLVNLINYQFDLALTTRNDRIVQDLKLNFDSLEQNYKSLQEVAKDKGKEKSELFKNGKSIIVLLNKKEWLQAKELIKEKNFKEQLEEFSFEIFDSTEFLAENRDKDAQEILSSINQTAIVSTITILFLIFLIRRIYKGYADNLKERLYAEEKAHLLSKQRETLIHVLCHDLRNPVSAIFSLVEIGHLLDDKAKENLIPTIKENAKESLDIIDLTRKMQALESGKFTVELTSISLNKCLDKSLNTLKSKIEGKEVIVEKNIDEGVDVLAEETTLVNSILNNILTNSIKFSKHNDKIQITSTVDQDLVKVIIRDFGIGIPAEILNSLFDETAQTSRLGTDGEVGTGFGMPLVKKFMESYGGQIIVESSTEGNDIGTVTTLIFKKAIT